MWQLAKAYSSRPSELLALGDPLAAYYLDRAVAKFGMTVDAELDRAEADAKNRKAAERKRQLVLARHLGHAGAFADPAGKAKAGGKG